MIKKNMTYIVYSNSVPYGGGSLVKAERLAKQMKREYERSIPKRIRPTIRIERVGL